MLGSLKLHIFSRGQGGFSAAKAFTGHIHDHNVAGIVRAVLDGDKAGVSTVIRRLCYRCDNTAAIGIFISVTHMECNLRLLFRLRRHRFPNIGRVKGLCAGHEGSEIGLYLFWYTLHVRKKRLNPCGQEVIIVLNAESIHIYAVRDRIVQNIRFRLVVRLHIRFTQNRKHSPIAIPLRSKVIDKISQKHLVRPALLGLVCTKGFRMVYDRFAGTVGVQSTAVQLVEAGFAYQHIIGVLLSRVSKGRRAHTLQEIVEDRDSLIRVCILHKVRYGVRDAAVEVILHKDREVFIQSLLTALAPLRKALNVAEGLQIRIRVDIVLGAGENGAGGNGTGMYIVRAREEMMHRIGRVNQVPAVLCGVIRDAEVVHAVHDAGVIVITVDVNIVRGTPAIEVVQEICKDLLVAPVSIHLYVAAPAGDEASAAAARDLGGQLLRTALGNNAV